MPQAYANPYSGLARGIETGFGMARMKAEAAMKKDVTALSNAFNMLNVKGLPPEKKLEVYNATIVPIANRMNPESTLDEMSSWPEGLNTFAKQAGDLMKSYNKGDLSSRDTLDSLELIKLDAGEQGKAFDISGLTAGVKRGERQAATGLQAVGVEGPLTEMGAEVEGRGGLTGLREYVEEGTVPPAAKEEKLVERTVDLGNEIEYIYTDGSRETKPKGRAPGKAGGGAGAGKWDKDAAARLDKLYGTQTEMGIVVDPERMAEYEDANTYLAEYKKMGLTANDAAVLAARRAKAGGIDPIQTAVDKYRELGKSDKEIKAFLRRSKFKSVSPRIYGLK